MTFLFVDTITSITAKSIRGMLELDLSIPFRYGLPGSGDIVAPGVISEAIGQLASWQLLESNGFKARPVFLFADRITHHRDVAIGARLELEAHLLLVDDDSARFSGTASLDGTPVHAIDECTLSFIPLDQLEDPDTCRQRFTTLTKGCAVPRAEVRPAFAWTSLRGETLALEPQKSIHRRLRLDPDFDFYATHFPRFPVTPAVILNEIAGQAAMAMTAAPTPQSLRLMSISGCKIRDFVRPGDTIDIRIRRVSDAAEAPAAIVKAQIEIAKQGRRIMHALWQFELVPGSGGEL
jgi:3-hydroxymyristoyl/3-hydroxydecanoyl-(acyl carrier protein) dehydratase